MFNWLVNGVARLLARSAVINPICNQLLAQINIAEEQLEAVIRQTERVREAAITLNNLLVILDGKLTVGVDQSVSGYELYERAIIERLQAISCAIQGTYYEPTIDCTDEFGEGAEWAFRRTTESVN